VDGSPTIDSSEREIASCISLRICRQPLVSLHACHGGPKIKKLARDHSANAEVELEESNFEGSPLARRGGFFAQNGNARAALIVSAARFSVSAERFRFCLMRTPVQTLRASANQSVHNGGAFWLLSGARDAPRRSSPVGTTLRAPLASPAFGQAGASGAP
jgi:hypothetical protein